MPARPTRTPVIRYVPTADRIRILADRATTAAQNGVSEMTVRRHCTPTDTDPDTGAALYDQDAAAEALAGIRPRRPRTAAARATRSRMDP